MRRIPLRRLHYVLTPTALLVCATVVAGKQYFGEPLHCWIPAEYVDSWAKFIENTCFVTQTYQAVNITDDSDMTQEQMEHAEGTQSIQYVALLSVALLLLFYA